VCISSRTRDRHGLAQVTAISQTLLRILPPGIFPPNILKYDASSVPVLQLGLEQQNAQRAGHLRLRPQLHPHPAGDIQGSPFLLPYGGKFRQIMVDLDPDSMLRQRHLATDVSNALNLQSLILPAGDAKFGDRDYHIKLNSSPVLDELNNLPVRVVNGATVYIKDVAQVRDGYAVQTSIVRTNGTPRRAHDHLRNGALPR
jgi:multidrug efflux pump subunit AcrB